MVVGIDIPDMHVMSYADHFPLCPSYAMFQVLHMSLYVTHYFPFVPFSDASILNMLLVVLACIYCAGVEKVLMLLMNPP